MESETKGLVAQSSKTREEKKSKGADDETAAKGEGKEEGKDEEKKGEEDKEEEKDSGPSIGIVGGEEEDKNVEDINVSGDSAKTVTIAGVAFRGNFVQTSPGVFVAQGEIKPEGFPISLGKAAGQLTLDKNRNRIEGQMYVSVPVFGKIVQVTDLIVSKTQLKFKGKVTEKVTIPVVNAEISLAEALADFEISTRRLACTATAGATIGIAIPKVGEVKFEVADVGGGFQTSIPPEGISISGEASVTIPFEPPIKMKLEGSAEITKAGISATGSATLFEFLEVANGEIKIKYDGVMTVDANVGAFLSDYGLEANLAHTLLTVDLPKRQLTAELSQSLKILDLVTIPGSVKGKMLVDGKAKQFSVSGSAKIPLIPAGMAPDQLSAGLQNFLIKIDNYNNPRTRVTQLGGELAVSVWTLGGFEGKIQNSVLDGRGNLYLPPGLRQLLDIEKVSLPVRIDLKSASILGDLGGDIAGLAIKHFPITGPKLIIKNDGVHLKGQIGIANVITIPLGDLVFTQNSSHTSIRGDMGLGPFTVAEGSFTFPASSSEGISFSGKTDFPGMPSYRLSGTIYRDGRVALSGLTKMGFISVDALTDFSVSKTGLHTNRAELGIGLGGVARCSLAFTSLDIDKTGIRGSATGKFTGVLGIEGELRGDFSFDGRTVTLSYPATVSLCGISVSNAKLQISAERTTGTGTISAAGRSKNVTITIENGVMKLKGPAGELIAEGMRIVDKLADTTGEIASEEKKVVEEDANKILDNLERMTEPWIKELVAAARLAKSIYNTIERAVIDKVTALAKTALDELKRVVDAAVLFAKAAIAAAVDAVCDGIIAMVDGVRAIFSQIESMIPDSYISAYQTVKNKVIEKANAVKAAVVAFRDNTKAALYDLTGTITAIYQSAIDAVTEEANRIAQQIKKEAEPLIKEIDALLTEIGQEIDRATSAAGQEAQRHYNAAKQKAEQIKKKAGDFVSKYKDKLVDLVAPYARPVLDKISAAKQRVEKERDAVIARAIDGLAAAKKTLEPVIKPLEDAFKELKDLASRIGGAVYQKFLDGVAAAGNALNSALGTAGKGLVKVTDIVGDAAVALTDAAADASQAAYQAAAATINFVKDTASKAVDAAVDTVQAGYQTATEAASQAAAALQQTVSQAYRTATQVASTAQRQVTSTINTIKDLLPPVSPSKFVTGSPVSFSDIRSGAQMISDKVKSILSTIDSVASSAYNAASGAASSIGSAVSSGASAVASGITSRWKKATGSIANLWGGTPSTTIPNVDYTAPAVMNVSATSTTNSFTVTYNTSFNARTIILYSATPNVNPTGKNEVTEVASIHTGDYYPETTNHSITVTGLNPGTPYYYLIYAYHKDAQGNDTNVNKQGPYMVVTQPATAIIGGLVKDTAGNAIADARIFLGQSTTPVATTDTTGRYTLEVNPGVHTVTARKDDYLSSSATTANLTAGQVLPLDFTLADGRIYLSGTVRDAVTNAALASATVTVSGPPSPVAVPTDASGNFSIVIGSTNDNPLSVVISATRDGYTGYTSESITLARGARMQNIEIKLPHVAPAVSGAGVNVTGISANQATVSFTTTFPCSAFVQLGPQSSANYTLQTPTETNKNSFTFNLVGLNPATAYKYRVVLQDSFGNTVVAKESTFTTAPLVTAATDIGLNATVTNITGNSAKLNITSAFRTLKHQLVLRDTTRNVQLLNKDLGLLVSPVSIDLNNLTESSSYTVELTSSLLDNVTSGSVLKTATKSVSFQTPVLKSVVIQNFAVTPANVKRGSTSTINVSASVRINHAVNGAVLKVIAGSRELFSQSLGNLTPGTMQVTVPLAVNAIPDNGSVSVKLKIEAGNIQETAVTTIEITRQQSQGSSRYQ